ncbi:extracellular solute-binding protein [Candidatus Pantoea multigeneris]|uniref:ABC transporter substrate-binding protein n=1 Tax=Candidatus Pantoea multigeneris TaxID=2608357 RepID=A0ABX0RKC6_9GAMM|nr:extracellular solute-binding protein [Pantoea multigeneris]NIF23770.1 ABC transporter substrate-binding protein [Pantoea multigeneris]
MKKSLVAAALCLAGIGATLSVQAATDIRVTYAGSMGKVMDQSLGPAFAKANEGHYEGQGQGAYGMARLLASKKITADVFVSITPGPMQILKDAGLIDNAVPVASTSMVVAWSPKSQYAQQFAAASGSNDSWLKVLSTPGLRFGRTDPINDPKGQNIIFTLLLAEKYYHQPGIAEKILGGVQNPAQVNLEGGLLTRLESGQVDAAAGYESEVKSAHLPYVALPDEINLSNPDQAKKWYDTVSFAVKDSKGESKTLHTQPLVYYAAVLKNAPHGTQAGQAFVDFMLSKTGQQLYQQNGYAAPKGGALY